MAQQSSYGAIPTEDPEQNVAPANNHEDNNDDAASNYRRTRLEVGEVIESKRAHVLIVSLTILDIILVILQIAATLLGLDNSKDAHQVLEIFAHISLGIVTFFVVEILLKVFAFGLDYFWINSPFGLLHLADAIIIFISFFLEVFLTGAEQELGALLIIFRLWRIVKLTGAVAIETAEHSQARIVQLESQIKELERENQRLRANTIDQV
ncbi:hypothetical protein BCR41DRAFT_352801 [Lobosporangium transversale]|uniref:Voltage-gated hydrogen channel 1 n=1 Tax=Lobosporangium transversale TaxID=64571 RepID=A0A1Y2GPQ6_9FUNG|nr:hypothetical protein BCR41DRAFT_352801 [Lobosporangium transversale]ORZ17596.1 hypothetical protein BCR41DRAFT_352801 [Lobosporangium transversale]|eukprot:XP_021881983.1 hypothetical protein BCR41DRAFT_352801 [Lobosporangium transversale]